MNRRWKISRATSLGLATSFFLYGGVWAVSHRLRPVNWTGDDELVALVAERDRLHDCDDHMVADWRRKQAALTRSAWTEEKFADWQAKLGPGWLCQRDHVTPDRRVILSRENPQLNDWPVFLAMVAELTGSPGVRIESLEIAAAGAGIRRRLTRIALTLRFTRAQPIHQEPAEIPAT